MSDPGPDDRGGSPEPEPFEGLEEGLAAERTDLAWSRSGLAMIGCGLLIARGLPSLTGTAGRPVVGALVLALGGAIWLLGQVMARRRHRNIGELALAARWYEVAPVAYGTAVIGLVALLVGAFRPA